MTRHLARDKVKRTRSSKWDCRFCYAKRAGFGWLDAFDFAMGEWGERVTRMHREYGRRRR